MRQIEAVPEQVRRARLPRETGREPCQHVVGESENPPPALDGLCVIAVVEQVVGERRAVAKVERLRIDRHLDADILERAEELGVELRTRSPVAKREPGLPSLARQNPHTVLDEIELDLDAQIAVRHRARRHAARRDVQRHVPPVITERHERHAHLADDLAVPVQRLLGRLPVAVGKRRPAHVTTKPTSSMKQ